MHEIHQNARAMQTFERQAASLFLAPYGCVDDSQRVDDFVGDFDSIVDSIDDSIGDSIDDLADDHDLQYEAVNRYLRLGQNESHATLLASILVGRFHYECNDESFQSISESQGGLLGPGCSSAETVRGESLEEWNPW